MTPPTSVIRCVRHGAEAFRFQNATEAQAIALHDFFVEHTRCQLVAVQLRQSRLRSAA